MLNSILASDFHGRTSFYDQLGRFIINNPVSTVFWGGDLLPPYTFYKENFVMEFIFPYLKKLKTTLNKRFPTFIIIMGNDDAKIYEKDFLYLEKEGLCLFPHLKTIAYGDYDIGGYPYIPPSPFLLKDWEKNDVSNYTDIGAVPIDKGYYSHEKQDENQFIIDDLNKLFPINPSRKFILLSHCPPYETTLDLIDTKNRFIDHIPLDSHIGSMAIKKWIKKKTPYLTLHGHVHESFSLSGRWFDQIGPTRLISAAGKENENSIVYFELEKPRTGKRLCL